MRQEDKSAVIDMSPKKAEDFSVRDLTSFVEKLLVAGADHHMVQQVAIYESKEQKMAAKRIVDAWKETDPLAIFYDYKKQWQMVYDHHFGLEGHDFTSAGLSDIVIPEIKAGIMPILVGKNIEVGQVIYHCKQLFTVETDGYNGYEIEKMLGKSNPDSTAYGVFTKMITNAYEDSRFIGKTGNDLQNGHEGITLLERLLMELFCYSIKGKHLDTQNYSSTICTGSYFKDRGIPTVRFSGDALQISCIAPDTYIADNKDCAREVQLF